MVSPPPWQAESRTLAWPRSYLDLCVFAVYHLPRFAILVYSFTFEKFCDLRFLIQIATIKPNRNRFSKVFCFKIFMFNVKIGTKQSDLYLGYNQIWFEDQNNQNVNHFNILYIIIHTTFFIRWSGVMAWFCFNIVSCECSISLTLLINLFFLYQKVKIKKLNKIPMIRNRTHVNAFKTS